MVDMPREIAAMRRSCRSEFFDMVASAWELLSGAELGRERDQVFTELAAERGMLQSEFDRRLHVAELAAAIVALALEFVGEHGLFGEQVGDCVGQLDFAAGAAPRRLQLLEDRRGQHVSTDDRERRRSIL